MGRKILVPIDLSAYSVRVLERARLILREEDEIVLLHVVLDPSAFAGFHIPHLSTELARETLLQEATKSMERFVARNAPGTVFRISFGIPFKEILAAALEEEADVIVIGSHQSSGRMERLLVSHASEKVIRNAPCDVLVVPLPIQSEEELFRRTMT
ncbi:MAG: universal stress protein [bacterium]|nr:MAG: universal stress protein [bacterium]